MGNLKVMCLVYFWLLIKVKTLGMVVDASFQTLNTMIPKQSDAT